MTELIKQYAPKIGSFMFPHLRREGFENTRKRKPRKLTTDKARKQEVLELFADKLRGK